MKAYYKTVLRGDTATEMVGLSPYPPYNVYEYKLLEMTEPCCEEMKVALEEGAVKFGEFDVCLNGDANINFAQCSAYPEGAVFTEYAIDFCPFCGKPVKTEERERVILKKHLVEVPGHTEVEYKEESLPLKEGA